MIRIQIRIIGPRACGKSHMAAEFQAAVERQRQVLPSCPIDLSIWEGGPLIGMSPITFKDLSPGDIVANTGNPFYTYTVLGNYGDHVAAVNAVDMTNPTEWELRSKVTRRQG